MSLNKLSNIAEVIMGQSPPGETYNSNGVGLPFFQGKSEFGKMSPVAVKWCTQPTKIAKTGDILISVRAPVGPTNIADQMCCIGRGLAAIRPNPDLADRDFVWLYLQYCQKELVKKGQGSTFEAINGDDLNEIEFPEILIAEQRQIATRLKAQLAEVETARQAAQAQLREVTKLADSIIYDSIEKTAPKPRTLGDVLDEVKKGIGQNWKNYPVLGATRDGLAPAREQPGKQAPKYKPAFSGTVFYNPMRILIGSIAFVDEDDTPGITSPDYVALRGKEGAVNSRWFYHWLRSPLGEQCILSLARGAVRERMLFNRLAEGQIELPDFAEQEKASAALKELRPLRRAIEQQLREIDLLPKKILAQAFEK